MGTPYLAEIRIFPYNFTPRGWAACDGQLLSISQNQALFALLGTYYGGNGITTFALPDLRGRVPIHFGSSPLMGSVSLGQFGGEENHTLIQSEMPAHIHTVKGSSTTGNQATPGNNLPASSAQQAYAATYNTTLSPTTVFAAGSSQPHSNMPPCLTLNFCIALQGLFPSRNKPE